MHRWAFLLSLLLFIPITETQDLMLDTLPFCDFAPLDDSSDMQVGAVILNFETGSGCTQSLDQSFNVASVPKLFVAGAYYDWMVQGLVTMNTPMTFTEEYWMGGQNDCLRQDDIDTKYTGSDLLEYMINCSDNSATWMLMDAVGWLTVNNYIQGFGIDGIGEVIPYSEVDRLKLSMIDETWLQVPRGMASRYFRGGYTSGLERYFAEVPTERLNPEHQYEGNSGYFLLYDTNTATPRALATYFMQLRQAMLDNPNSQRGLVARLLFSVMLYTQRLNSVQGLDGTLLIGGKNGFDRGIVAETSVLFNDMNTLVPSGMVIVFTQQKALDSGNIQSPSPVRGPLNAYMRDLSEQVATMLYPNQTLPLLTNSFQFSSIILQEQSVIETCWQPYFSSSFDETRIDSLEACFRSWQPRRSFNSEDNATFGLVLRGLNGIDARMVFVYTAPDGSHYSYQTDRQYQDKTAVYWYHPVQQKGEWQLDIYLNRQRVARETFFVQ